jgi:gliding motility-associated-like protein
VAGAGYQWRNGAVPVGTNSNVFVATASGSYSVEVSVPGCAVVSSVNTVTVNAIAPPAVPVITPAAPAAVCAPATVSLSIAPPGAGVNIQWYRDGVAIAGANAANYTATVSGSYTVELSASGCPNVLSAAVIVTINNPVSPFTINNTLPLNICAGENVTLSISPPIAGATYQWKNGGTNVGTNSNVFVATASGTYTCEVSVPGCPPVPSTNSVVVTQDAIPATPGPISGPASLCAGGSGTYSIAAVPGATGYTWVLPAGWSGSSTTNSISVTAGSTGGNISVTANNDCGSSPVSIQALVVDPATPAPGAISGPASLCAGSSGSYSIAAVPGATGYTWVLPAGWSGSSTTNSITVTAGSTGGNISVLAIGPCGNSVTSVLAVSPAAAAVAPTITGVAAPCSSSVQIYAVGNVQTGVTYNWTITGGTPATASGSVVTINWGNGSTGNIEVSAVGPCNTATQNQAITLGVPQNVNIPTGPEVRCKGETGVYSVSPTAGNSYEWAVDGGVILSGQGTNSITVQWTTDSAGSVAVTESNSCGAGKPQTLAISIPTALPPGSIFPDTVACQNQKAVVYGLPKITGVSYFWTVSGGTIISGADSNIVLVDWGSGSSGSLTIQARSSCDTLIRTQVITLVAAPTLPTITGPDSICSGVAVNFRATGGAAGVSYQWSAIGGAIQSGQGTDAVTVFWGSSAPYRISVVAINGNCPSDTVSKNLNIGNNAPSLTPIIARRSVSCTGSTDTFSITTATGVSYNWAVTNGTILSGQGSNQIVVQFNVAGNSVISVVGQNGCGKDSTGINVNILEYNPPASIAGNDSICVGSSQNYSIVGQSGATYRWIAAGGTIVGAANGTSVQINWLSSGVNTVTVIEQHPCSLLVVERKIFVREDGTLGVIAGERRTCTSGLQTYRLVGGIPKGTNISWQAAGGSIIGVQNADSVVVRWDSVLSGVASIVAEAIGCSTQTVSLAVSLLPISKPVPVASKFIICAGDSIAFADSSRGIAGRWLWDFGDGFASSDSAPRHTFTRPGVYTVSLTTSISGQCEDSASIRTQIVVNSVPEGRILVAANPSNLSDQSALYFEGTGADTLYWYLSDSNIAVADTFPFDSIRTNYKRADRYKVRVRAVSRGGCEVWDSTEVFIENFLLIDFPTAFSPNGDGNNDRLTFIHRGISDYTLEIYNRWGDLLFTGRPGQYWDGTYERKPLPEGVYVYVLKLPNGDTRKGSITLIR